MMSQLNMAAIALCLSAITLLGSLIAVFRGKSRPFNIAGMLISSGLVILSAGMYLGLVGGAMSSVALLSAAFSVAGAVFLYRANKKPASGGTA